MTEIPAHVGTVILTAGEIDLLREQVATLRQRNIRIMMSATCLEDVQLAEALDVDGVIAKGHEAGGWVGEETTFILLQRLLGRGTLPVWAHGGLGLHAIAACYAAGAAGVVLDSQFALLRESSLPESVRATIARMDGSETVCLGSEIGAACRVYARPRLAVLEELRELEGALEQEARSRHEVMGAWREAVQARIGWGAPDRCVWPLGQDAAFAGALAQRFRTVAAALSGLRDAVGVHCRLAQHLRPLDQDSPLARSHETRYPIVQGPMTRVSDTAAFAESVATGGALPFLALALLRGGEVRSLLEETRRRLGDRPWGVGILGFVPLELRQEQMDVIRAVRPPFALIAGGRPDQALSLEQSGIPTYLHVPSPGLLTMFLENGAHRFVFEGRECGGHVGPRSSFVLWELMIDVLLDKVPPGPDAERYHVLFAGGIHDALSASMVSTMAAPLAERGIRVGVLLGTAYLFTAEAVASGAIVETFQEEALRCQRTILLETGPGHSTRCVDTTFGTVFTQEKHRLTADRRLSPDEIRNALEELNLGRLRIASKGISRNPQHDANPTGPRFIELNADTQRAEGMYMIGQVGALRHRTCTVAELHHNVAAEGSERLARLAVEQASPSRPKAARPCDVAIIGMACLLPKAPDLHRYWENIVNKVDAITEIPPGRWDWRQYYDPEPRTPDKIYSKWGGFIDAIPFDPMRYGMPPNTLPSIEPVQLLTLEVVGAALADAGYADRPFRRERTGIVMGVGGGAGDLGQQYAFRSTLPLYLGEVAPDVWKQLPQWTEDSFAGILLNVVAGRVANRFDLGGVNYTVDAACASSLAAVYLAVRELEAGTADMMLVGGADTVQNPFAYLCFSKTQALSPRGRCRTFDAGADGIVIAEGIGVLVLKRLEDAERDGDRIYAVIKSVAGSSDGRDRGLTAPRPEGQIRALERAYTVAGFSPDTVGLIEAHGTGTVAGDRAEVESLTRVLAGRGATPQSCAIGSVKSMIGHTKCTAGVAGLIKVALALHHRVLPPTNNVEQPNPKAFSPDSPFYVNTEARPWLPRCDGTPRRAGVSSFGFGGTNFHAVLEENPNDEPSIAVRHWPCELFVWSGRSHQEIVEMLEPLEQGLKAGATPALRDLAYAVWQDTKEHQPRAEASVMTLAIVATTLDDFRQQLSEAREKLAAGQASISDPRGIYFSETPLADAGQIAFLFPGQGSQQVDMLRDLAVHFAEVREAFAGADKVLAGRLPEPLSAYVFPPPRFSAEAERSRLAALTQTNVAQPALGAADIGLMALLRSLGVEPRFVAGHSYGEYVALCAAGVFDEDTLYRLSEARGRAIIDAAGDELGTMAAVQADSARITTALAGLDGVWISNLNAPAQTVISGTRRGIEAAVRRLDAEGLRAQPVPVACAFHSPLIAPARDAFAAHLATVELLPPRIEVFSNTTAAPYPLDQKAIAALLADHLVRPVKFGDQIEAMYQAGARIFIEVGPRSVLTNLVQQNLGTRPYVAVAPGASGRSGLLSLQLALAQLAAHGVALNLDRLFEGREARRLDIRALMAETPEAAPSATTWMVHGGRAWPTREQTAKPPVPVTLAPAMAADAPAAEQPTFSQASELQTSASTGSVKPQPVPTQQGSVQAPPVPTANAGAADVMRQFQQLMDRFLETQRHVMLAYLQASHAVPSAATPLETAATAPAAAPRVESPSAGSDTQLLPSTNGTSRDNGTGPNQTEVPAPAAAAGLPLDGSNPERLTRGLLQIVSERTGYPAEMLDLDLNMEADLGIDSIKRVEILGAFQRAYVPSSQGAPQEIMEKLTGVKTLRRIVDTVLEALDVPPQTAATTPGVLAPPVTAPLATPTGVDVPRSLVAAVEVSLEGPSVLPVSDRPLILTDDGRGVAQAAAGLLRNRGARVVVVSHRSELKTTDPDTYSADLADPAAVEELIRRLRHQYGPLGGVIHLLPLRTPPRFDDLDLAAWRECWALTIKSLSYLIKAIAADAKRATETETGFVLAAATVGGHFASDAMPMTFHPAAGGVAGLLKTVALEWPAVRCKVIDVEAAMPAAAVAAHVLREIAAADGQVEVGYRGGRRFLFRPRPSSLQADRSTCLCIDSSWVLLITGGARGITAEVACDLAVRYRPTIILAGRSVLPGADEAVETRELTGHELKRALIQQLGREAQPPALARIEAAYTRLLCDREIRRNIVAMREAGAAVHYYQVDVRDEQAFGHLIDDIYASYGGLDGVIHGAGVIEDKLLAEKAPDSFDRVFDTKADSAFILSRKLQPASLKFLAFFSSVAGVFGNRGQADYAAANEVLNNLAMHLDRTWPARVVAINWGPWGKAGMVSPEVERQFVERRVQIIPPASGCRVFDAEIRLGAKGESEVILGGGAWVKAAQQPPAGSKPAGGSTTVKVTLPLLNGIVPSLGKSGALEVIRRLDPAHDMYLRDHQLDGKPVFPTAMAMELMAEVAQHGWPEWQVSGIHSLRVMRGIVLENGAKALRIMARPQVQSVDGGEFSVDVEILEAGSSFPASYHATIKLADRLTAAPSDLVPRPLGIQPFPMSAAEAYRRWLFHGPLFQRIVTIEGMNGDWISAIVSLSSPGQCLIDAAGTQWLIDPVVVDSAFQLAILWARAHHDMTPLPSKLGAYRRLGVPSGAPIRCHLRGESSAGGAVLNTQIFFSETDGRLIGVLENMEFTCSKALNRLGGTVAHHIQEDR